MTPIGDESGAGPRLTRRDVLQASAAGGAWLWWTANAGGGVSAAQAQARPNTSESQPVRLPDLQPARWLWYPSSRCLQNTFVLFRRTLDLTAKPRRATGWIIADSRYCLQVNGQRVQFGPPPCDPRYAEADPVDLTSLLQEGPNVIGATVLFYGAGDGAAPIGKPGFLFWLEIEHADGKVEKVVSDASWQAHLARAWRPGHYKRWYLRALQEEFDARLYPYGWATPAFKPVDRDWLAAMPVPGDPNKPAVCSGYDDYQFGSSVDDGVGYVIRRQVPMMREHVVPVAKLAESMWIDWRRSPEEYFECGTPDAFTADRAESAKSTGGKAEWTVDFTGVGADRGATLTFEFAEQIVGWPRFTIEAPAGTVVELMVQEAHKVGGPPLLNSHFHSWGRFICREGANEFETFDFESCRWLQLHIHGASGAVRVSGVGMRRRVFPWPNEPKIHVDEPPLQRLMDATINTLNNCAQDNCVDGMGRERQQYSGDCGHQLHAIWLATGETRLPARYLRTFSQGMTRDGYFLDCWPAYDRLCRVMTRQVNLAYWGPILDHGVGLNFDCLYHYLYTGDVQGVAEPFPRLVRFARYLESIRGNDGLLPVENIGVPCVWIDHIGFNRQGHKQCAFNLYAAAMLEHALPVLARAMHDDAAAAWAEQFGRDLRESTVKAFWSPRHRVFVDNLPWLDQEKTIRMHDRALATAVLFDQCPNGETEAAVRAMADCPPEMGFSYPANAGWRLWALAKAGRGDVIVSDLRKRWATMPSVLLNNTLAEDWECSPDSGSQWSHCPVVPVYVLYMSVAGIRPLDPGFTRCEIRPQLADLGDVELVAQTVRGPIEFVSHGRRGNRELTISLPPGCEAELVLDEREQVKLDRVTTLKASADLAAGVKVPGHVRYRLPAGSRTVLALQHG